MLFQINMESEDIYRLGNLIGNLIRSENKIFGTNLTKTIAAFIFSFHLTFIE